MVRSFSQGHPAPPCSNWAYRPAPTARAYRPGQERSGEAAVHEQPTARRLWITARVIDLAVIGSWPWLSPCTARVTRTIRTAVLSTCTEGDSRPRRASLKGPVKPLELARVDPILAPEPGTPLPLEKRLGRPSPRRRRTRAWRRGVPVPRPLPGRLVPRPLPGRLVPRPLPGWLVPRPLPGRLVPRPLRRRLAQLPPPARRTRASTAGVPVRLPLRGRLVPVPPPGRRTPLLVHNQRSPRIVREMAPDTTRLVSPTAFVRTIQPENQR